MIQTYVWEMNLDGHDPREVTGYLDSLAAGTMARTAFFKGISHELVNESFLKISVKVHGKDRWGCQAHARMIAEKLFGTGLLHTLPIVHVDTIVEPNRWTLKDGQGRTPRPRPPRLA